MASRAKAEPIEDTARLYNCARCHVQTVICRCCDRGNVYCRDCALPARQETQRRASKRYQESPPGRQNHAARQRRYRERQREEVTHTGCVDTESPVAHSTERTPAQKPPLAGDQATLQSIFCHFCSAICSQFLRLDYLLRPG